MADIEVKTENDLNTEIGNQEIKTENATLEEEIKIEEESRKLNKDNVKNFEKSQKPKKSLKNKIISWALGLGVLAGSVAGGVSIYKNNFSEKAKYNKEIQTKFEQVDATLTERIYRDTDYKIFDSNQKIEYLRFNDESGEEKILEVFFEGDKVNQASGRNYSYDGSATYKVLEEYYNSLVDAEESNNMLTYLDALNQVFETMEYQKSEIHDKIEWTNAEKTEENVAKINELFALDFEDDNIVKQVGFLPYNIEVIEWNSDDENHNVTYTYKIHGISYCETKNESKTTVQNNDDLIMNSDYDKSHIETYYRDITFSSCCHFGRFEPDKFDRLQGDILMYIDGLYSKDDISIKTTYFQKTDLFENYNLIKEGKTKFNVPEKTESDLSSEVQHFS